MDKFLLRFAKIEYVYDWDNAYSKDFLEVSASIVLLFQGH